MTYNIIEVANTHGGKLDYILELIAEFSQFKGDFGMKFQPLSAEKLATKDFSSYHVYEEISFDLQQWDQIIDSALKTKDIWLDIFDTFGLEVLERNSSKVHGIKLQVSVLFNEEIFRELKKIDLSDKRIILNVAALEMEEIAFFLDKYSSNINPKEILLEVGFQGYPTKLQDSGLSKINVLKERFGNKIVFADHIDRESDYAIWFPGIAVSSGADIIEKHVMLENRTTKYDFYSSLDLQKYSKMVEIIDAIDNLKNAGFINENEVAYLNKSIMKPILKNDKKAGQLLALDHDFIYRRSDLDGLNVREIEGKMSAHNVLKFDKVAGETIQEKDFREAKIAVIIACRLKSSRLKQKALLKIGNLTSVEFCIKNALKFKNTAHVILATSNLSSDESLQNYTFDDSVVFHTGHPEDVIQRYLDVIRKLNIDVVVRVTADNPFIDNEIFELLLKSHFEKGADYTTAEAAAVGTNLEIMNAAALEKIKGYFPNADYSEYMTWYFQNNPEHFNLNFYKLPEDLVRGYRLTLDYHEDLELFNIIHEQLEEEGNYSLRKIFNFLDENSQIASMNNHYNPRYSVDEDLIKTLNEATKIK